MALVKSYLFVILFLSIIVQLSYSSECIDSATTNSLRFHRGVYSFSGNFFYSYTSFSNSDQTISVYSASPIYLRFTSSKFAFGGQFIYLAMNNTVGRNTVKTSLIGIGPIFRYYLLHDDPFIFVAASLIVSGGESKSGNFSVSNGGNSFASISVGMNFFFTKNVSLEPLIQYQFSFSGGSSSGKTVMVGMAITTFID